MRRKSFFSKRRCIKTCTAALVMKGSLRIKIFTILAWKFCLNEILPLATLDWKKKCMCSRSNNGHCHLHCIPPSEWKLFGCRHWQTDTHTYNEMKIEPHFGLTPTISESIRWLWLIFCEIDHVSVVYLVDEMHSSWVAFLIFEICKIN